MIFLSDYLRIFTRGGNVSNPSHQYINKSTINLSFHWKLKYMVTNGNWASINTNTNTNLPFSVLAASLFYCLVEYPIFLMTAVVSILPGSMPGFGLIARKFPDPNSADLSAQILSQHLWWPPGASQSLTNSIHHPGNPVPSLERVESFSGSLQIKLVGFWKSPFFFKPRYLRC